MGAIIPESFITSQTRPDVVVLKIVLIITFECLKKEKIKHII